MKNSKFINSLALIGVLFSSTLAVVLTHNSSEAIVDRAVRKDVAHEVVSADPMTYAQVGTANGSDRLRFATPVKDVTSASVITYTRNVGDGVKYEEKQVTVKSVYKSIAGSGTTKYFYDGAKLVTENPNNNYYWANYVAAFSENSEAKDEMFSVVLDVDGTKAPFLSASYNSVLAEGPVASFVDASGTLLGRSIVESGNVPVYVGEVPVVIDADFIGWSDGETVYETLPAITTDTVFKAEYGYPLTLDNPYASVAMEAKYVTGEASFANPHKVVVKEGNEVYDGEVTYTSSDPSVLTVDGDNVTTLKAGQATVTVSAEGEELGNFTVNVTEYTPIRDETQFLKIGTNQETMSKNYILMNDIDFEGGNVESFSTNATKATKSFTGIFDGQGYALKNFTLVKSTMSNAGQEVSLFGNVGIDVNNVGVVKNLNVTGAKMSAPGAVIVSWLMNGSTVDNCFVDVTVTNSSGATGGNYGAAVVMRAQAGSIVQNCIAALTINDTPNTEKFGAIVGNNLTAVKNCQAIDLSNKGLSAVAYLNGTKASISNCNVYTSISAFYDAVSVENYSGWVFDVNKEAMPYVGKID